MKTDYVIALVVLVIGGFMVMAAKNRRDVLNHSLNAGENPHTREGYGYTYSPAESNWTGGFTTVGPDPSLAKLNRGNNAANGPHKAAENMAVATDNNTVGAYIDAGISLYDLGYTNAGWVTHPNNKPLVLARSYYNGGGINAPLIGTDQPDNYGVLQ